MSLEKDTVQQTLCIPLWCRAVSTERQPSFFPDHDAARILAELGEPRSKSLFYRLEYPNLQCIVRQYDMACEIARYVEAHPQACVVEMGAGLSCQRCQMTEAGMAGARNPWYTVDLPNVIELRERLIPADGVERRVAGDLNDFSWMDGIDFSPERGAVFIGAGLFYYFMKDDVRRLVCELARRFPGAALAFDATDHKGIKGVNKEVELAGNASKSFFFLDDSKAEIPAWSPEIAGVEERDYFSGYATPGVTFKMSPLTKLVTNHMSRRHLGFIVHVDFAR